MEGAWGYGGGGGRRGVGGPLVVTAPAAAMFSGSSHQKGSAKASSPTSGGHRTKGSGPFGLKKPRTTIDSDYQEVVAGEDGVGPRERNTLTRLSDVIRRLGRSPSSGPGVRAADTRWLGNASPDQIQDVVLGIKNGSRKGALVLSRDERVSFWITWHDHDTVTVRFSDGKNVDYVTINHDLLVDGTSNPEWRKWRKDKISFTGWGEATNKVTTDEDKIRAYFTRPRSAPQLAKEGFFDNAQTRDRA
jgi:hypothetical protein